MYFLFLPKMGHLHLFLSASAVNILLPKLGWPYLAGEAIQ